MADGKRVEMQEGPRPVVAEGQITMMTTLVAEATATQQQEEGQLARTTMKLRRRWSERDPLVRFLFTPS
jgi:hypothetical protein